MAKPNFIPGIGGLATSRYDFQSHVTGTPFYPSVQAFRHNANQIDLNPSVNIDGYLYYTVETALMAIAVGLTSGFFFTPSGDLAGTSSIQKVVGLDGYAIASTAPVEGAVPIFDVFTNKYDIRPLTTDDILPGFSINSFTGGQTVEIGTTITNPTFNATYNTTPTSANITNTVNINSPFTLTTPFASATITGAFSAPASQTSYAITFTLQAILTSAKTANQSLSYLSRNFGGVGTPGASASVTAAGNNAILSTSNTINSLGLFSSDVGQVFGPFSPSGQVVYLLLLGGSHTFKDNNTGFSFPFNTPTPVSFINQHGYTVQMYLYQSSSVLSATYSILVVS